MQINRPLPQAVLTRASVNHDAYSDREVVRGLSGEVHRIEWSEIVFARRLRYNATKDFSSGRSRPDSLAGNSSRARSLLRELFEQTIHTTRRYEMKGYLLSTIFLLAW
jgi:hypothetical protein